MIDIGHLKDWLTLIGAAFSVTAVVIGFIRWKVVPFVRRAAFTMERLYDLANHELTPNSGDSTKDRLVRVESAFYPDTGPSIPELIDRIVAMVGMIEQRQLLRVSEMDSRHHDNIVRLGRLEHYHEETQKILADLQHQQGEFAQLQDYGMRVLPLAFRLLASKMSEEVMEEMEGIIDKNPPPKEIGRG